MFDITIFNTLAYFIAILCIFYGFVCWRSGQIIRPNYKELLYYMSLFSVFGVIGEALVNPLYNYAFSSPLWEYQLYPAHNADISYFFFAIWGGLGFYTYFRNHAFRNRQNNNVLYSGIILGSEAILLEFIINIPFHFLFGSYIFYYFPANLGPLSHFSCLQVVPFYMIVGYIIGSLIRQQELLQYRGLRTTLGFYWMIAITFVFL